MAIDWQRLADDDYYADVCTKVYETCQQGILDGHFDGRHISFETALAVD